MAGAGLITIRGHHLLCMLGFRGHGYTVLFTGNLERIITQLARSADLRIVLTASCDAICAACPHMDGDICAKPGGSGPAVVALDEAVLDRIEMAAGDCATVSGVYERVAQSVDVDEIGTRLCVGCEWLDVGFCTSGLARLKSSGSPFDGRWNAS